MKPVRLVDDSPTMLSDYHMPGMHGVDLIGKLRRIASTRFTRMLMLTTYSQPEKRGAAKAAGATGWLVKPVDATALLQIVTQLSPGK
jgi:two-component system, chemotaxis family, chemotaxis protein CheY